MADSEENHIGVPLIEPEDMAVVPVQTSERRLSLPAHTSGRRLSLPIHTLERRLSPNVLSVNNQHLVVMGLVGQATRGISFKEEDEDEEEEHEETLKERDRRITENAMITTLSALYAKLLVLLGLAFPVTEALATELQGSFYQSFYLYLNLGSITFMCFLYAMTLKEKAVKTIISRHRRSGVGGQCRGSCQKEEIVRYGSFYLRLGAMGFGIGSMVYSGLEVGQHFARETDCDDTLLVLRSSTRMLLTLMQIQFMFLNNKDMQMGRYISVARFGLMHMVATNLCEWLYVLVEETKHDIEHLSHISHPSHHSHQNHHNISDLVENLHDHEPDISFNTTDGHRTRRSASSYQCSRSNIVGMLVQKSSAYLFPCTIEYSLICAVTLYEMWKHIKIPPIKPKRHVCNHSTGRKQSSSSLVALRTAHNFTVDCHNAHKGLGAGILVLVLTIISLILFLVLHNEEAYKQLAVYEVSLCEMGVYLLCVLVVLACMFKIRRLPVEKNAEHSMGLDNNLLIMAQAGMYVYCIFSIIGFKYAEQTNVPGGVVIEILALMQTTAQTMLVLDGSSRRCKTKNDKKNKPGRQLITFLLIANAAMWMINAMQKGHAQYSPEHLRFFGVWPWTVITHVSMPLAIFYRFHSTICLFEIWKATYKIKIGR